MRHVPILLALLFAGQPVFAWENDFHFGLTKWLAFQAGYSMSDANLIAQGTLNPDLGMNDARWLVAMYACLKRDPQASMHVRDLHFPSFAPIPSPPADRKVSAGSQAAERAAWKEVMYDRQMTKEELDYALKKLGEALHPLQDSWSHAGVPSVPSYYILTTCDNQLAWGHPGEWDSHNADLTYLNQNAAKEAASRTYDFLTLFRQGHSQVSHHDAVSWKDLESKVEEFVQANTKHAKRDWFIRNEFSNGDLDFLNDIYLPDSKPIQNHVKRTIAQSPSVILISELKDSMPTTPKKERTQLQAAHKALQRLFDHWFVRQDFYSLMEMIEPAVLQNTYKDSTEAKSIDPSMMIHLRFRPWTFRDHGLANLVNHGRGITQNQADLIWSTKENTAPYESWENALIPFCSDDSSHPYLVFPLYDDGHTIIGYAALARIKHAPHDVIVLELDQNLKIISFSWEIAH